LTDHFQFKSIDSLEIIDINDKIDPSDIGITWNRLSVVDRPVFRQTNRYLCRQEVLMMYDVSIQNNPEGRRFEARSGEALATLEYTLQEDRLVLIHTFVPQEMERRGIGGALVKTALECARARGIGVVTLCPFAKSYLESHPEYQDLIRALKA
jgi:predicted GNAT family acetyltransferase